MPARPRAGRIVGIEPQHAHAGRLVGEVDQHRPAVVAAQQPPQAQRDPIGAGPVVVQVDGARRLGGEPHEGAVARGQNPLVQRRRRFLKQPDQARSPSEDLLAARNPHRRATLVGEDQDTEQLAGRECQQDDQHELAREIARPQPPHPSWTSAVKL